MVYIEQDPAAFVPLAQRAPGVSQALAQAVDRSLAMSPEGRFASADEMKAGLRVRSSEAETLVEPPQPPTVIEADPAGAGGPAPRPRHPVIRPAARPALSVRSLRLNRIIAGAVAVVAGLYRTRLSANTPPAPTQTAAPAASPLPTADAPAQETNAAPPAATAALAPPEAFTAFPLPSPDAAGQMIYIVQRGDTLIGIAWSAGCRDMACVERLKQMNGLSTNFVFAGQRLIIGPLETATPLP